LARFRLTALPAASPALTPTRTPGASDIRTTNTTSGWEYDFPEYRTCLKSVERVRRKPRFTHTSHRSTPKIARCDAKFLPADVLDVLVAADSQADAAFQTPTLENRATIGRGHALAEAVYAYAPADPGLISTFGCH
jgi:hypothetical protein